MALAEEGAALREALGPGPAIYVFAGLMPGDAPLCRDFDLVPCLNSAAQMAEAARDLPGRPCGAAARHRHEPARPRGRRARRRGAALLPGLAPVLVLSHLACADEPDHPLNRRQAEAFAALAARLPGVRRSLAATGGILLGPDFHFGLTRPGIGLYGGLPFAAARPVVTLSLPVIQVRDVAPGETVGYGAAWTAAPPQPHRRSSPPATPTACCARSAAAASRSTPATPPARWSAGSRWTSSPPTSPTSPRCPTHLEILNARQTVDDLARAPPAPSATRS